jgi:NitT/TauT family transport system permease protein
VRGRLPGLLLLASLLGLWEWAGRRSANYVFAPPSEVVSSVPAMIRDGSLPDALATSLESFALGFALAALVGIAVGFAMGWWPLVGRLLNPYVSAFYVVPIIALVPLILIWIGFGMEARVLVIFLFSVFEILLSALAGIRSVEPLMLDVARSFGAGRARTLRRLVLPASLPYVLMGLRLGASRAIKGMITAEILFALTGLGGLLSHYRDQFATAPMLVVVATVALVGVAVSAAIQLAERRLLRWRPALTTGHSSRQQRGRWTG